MRSRIPIALALLLLAGCGEAESGGDPTAFAMHITAPPRIAADVVSVTLTVFGGNGDCDMASGNASGTPLAGLDAEAIPLGVPTTLSVSSGDRTFFVIAYDVAGDDIARGCTTLNLQAGKSYDIPITLVDTPTNIDAGVDAMPDAGGIAGDDCADPIPLPGEGTPVAGTTVGAADDFASSCGGGGLPDVVFVLDVPTASHAVITATAPGAAVTASLRSTCATLGSEIACAGPDAADTTVIDVGNLPMGTYFVLVDAGDLSALGQFSVTAVLTAPTAAPENDTCAAPTPIVPSTPDAPVLPASGTLVDAADDATSSLCGGDGPEVFYQLDLAAPQRVEITVTSSGFDPVVFVRTACGDPVSELACADDQLGMTELSIIRELAAGTYYIAVDSTGATGTFTIAVDLFPPPPANDECGGATPLAPNATVMGETLTANDDQPLACGVAGSPDVYYTFTLASARHVTLTLDDASSEHALAVLTGCGGTELLGGSCASTVATATLDFPSLPAGTYVVVVEGPWDSMAGPGIFDLSYTSAPPVPPADECLTASTLSLGATTTGNLATGPADDDASASCGGAGGDDQVYSFFIGATQHVTISTGAGFPHVISLRSACADPLAEVACAQSVNTMGSEVGNIDIGALPAGTYHVWFDQTGAGASDMYSIRVDSNPPLLPPPNDQCVGAAPLAAGLVSGTLLNGVDDTTASCGGAAGAEVYYTFTLAQPKRVRATANGTGFDPVLSLRTSCAVPATEVACANGGVSGNEQLEVLSLAAGTYTLVVDSVSAATGNFSLLWEVLDPPPPNDSCASPTLLAPGTLIGQTLAGAAADEIGSGACLVISAADVVYQFTTAADQQVQITVSSPGFNAAAYLRSDCTTDGADLACANAGAASETIDRPFLAAGTYYVVVERVSGAGTTFDISLTLLPPVIPGDSCASPVVLPGTGGADSSSTIGKANDTAGTCGGAGADAVYQFTITGARHVTVNANSSGAFDYALYLRATDCVAGAQASCVVSAGGVAAIDILNLAAGTYYVFVDALGGVGGPFDISLTATSAVPPPGNDTCAAPGSYPAGAGQTLFGANDDYGASCNPVGGVEDVYTFTLTQTSRVTATANATGNVAVYLGTTCGAPATELGCVNATSTGVESLTVDDLPPGTYFVYVEGVGGFAGSFTPTLTITPPPANDACAGSVALSSGTTLSGQTLVAAGDSVSGSCAGGGTTRDVFYNFTLATRSVVDLTIGNTVLDTSATLTATCGGVEIACSAATSPGEAGHFVDLGAGTYTVLVDGPASGAAGTFDITYTAAAVPDNNSCVAPETLAAGVSTPGTLASGTVVATNEYTGSCGGATGGDVVYQFTLATAQRVVTTVTRTSGTFDPVVYLRSSCAAAGSEPAGGCSNAASGAVEVDDIDSLPAGTYDVIVDSAGGTPGTFTVAVDLLPIPPANDRCPGVVALTESVAAPGTTQGARDDTTGTCSAGGAEVFYQFTLATARRVVVSLSGATSAHALYVQGTCGSAATQIGCASTGSLNETLDLLNLSAGTYTVVVEAETAAGSAFSVVHNTFPPVANDTCAAAIVLTDPVTRTGDSSIGALDQETGGCAGGGTTPETFYQYTLTSARHVNLQVTSNYDAAVSLRTTCNNAGTETMCGNLVAGAGTETIDIRTQPAGTYFVVVDGVGGASGSADVSFSTTPPPPAGDWCPEVQTVATNVTTTSQSLSSSYANDETGSCGGAGVDRVYTFTIAGNQHVNLVTQSTTLAHRLYVRSAVCGGGTEQGCAASVFGATHTATLDFPNLAAGTYYVFVDAANAGEFGSFDITPTVTAPSGAPTNDTCATATFLPEATALGGSLNAALDDTAVSCGGAGNNEVFYTFTLATNRYVTITGSPAGAPALNLSVTLRGAGCAATEVPAGAGCVNAAGAGGTEQIIQENLAAGTYYVVVEGLSGTSGSFNISYTTAAPIVRPANDQCAGAVALTTGTPRVGDNVTNALNDSSGSCGGASGNDVGYSFTIGAGPNQRARITVSNVTGGWDPVLHAHAASCGGVAVGCAQTPGGTSEVLDMPNLAPGTYYVWVDELLGVSTGTFDILLELLTAVPPPSNDICTGAIALTDGVTRSGDTTLGAADDYDLSCLAFDSRDTVYSFTVPAGGKSALITLTPTSPYWDAAAALRTSANCGTGTGGADPPVDMSCEAEPAFLASDARYITQPNLAAGTYDIIVDGDSGATGTYDVKYETRAADTNFGYWRIDRPTTAFSSIAGTAGATQISISTGNPGGGNWNQAIGLPFSFPYFGTSYATVNASSDMYLTFDAGITGDPSHLSTCGTPANPPNNIIALFWDGGYSFTTSSQLWTKAEGTTPNRRFTVEYVAFNILRQQGGYWILTGIQVTQKVILYENGDIEFHYGPRSGAATKGCADAIGGCDAVVGLEGQVMGATQAYQALCEVAGSITDGKNIYWVMKR